MNKNLISVILFAFIVGGFSYLLQMGTSSMFELIVLFLAFSVALIIFSQDKHKHHKNNYKNWNMYSI